MRSALSRARSARGRQNSRELLNAWQALARKLGAAGFFEASAKTGENVDAAFFAAARLCRELACGYVSTHALARDLVVLALCAHRHDAGCAFAKLPRDVVALIGRFVLADARDFEQRAHWDKAMAAYTERAATKTKAQSHHKCTLQ